ncbi:MULTISPECIES: shikimate kinase [unclassified Haladaptatus]|uniref:shikimate kinase n=1 Tax=unclassified Haladaptatus TaxID=2622732 RepID=UPI0023E85B19|nr:MULTISPECIES: shikimate kinase [unclassified Haladaptatus]
MEGTAQAPAAGTILNALATGTGAAFAIDRYTTAHVTLSDDPGVTGEIANAPDADTRLVERCVELVTERFGDGQGGHVRTESDVPMASGLKSSSAAANATVLATLSALDAELDREDAARIGVTAARETGVAVTGAFDDASASMLGGATVTDNTADELLHREEVDWDVLVWTPDEQSFSADADVARCKQVAPMADLVADLALAGDYERAMTVNGLAFCAALDFPTDPLVEAMPLSKGVSLSGTGPSFTAVGDRDALEQLEDIWSTNDGHTWLTTTQNHGARLK